MADRRRADTALPGRCLGRLEVPAPAQSRRGVRPRPSASNRAVLRRRPAAGLGPGAAALPAFADQAAGPGLTNTVSIVSATYTGVVQDKVAQFDATLQIATTATNQIVPLFGDDIALQSFATKGEARLVREGRTVGVLLPARGSVSLQLKLIAKLGGDVTRRQLAFGIPPALSSRVNVTIDEAEADVEFPTAVCFRRTSANQQTRVEAVIGPAERLELNWTPRVKRAAEIVATVFVQNTALVTFGGGVIKIRATLDYQISQGELKQVRVQLPARPALAARRRRGDPQLGDQGRRAGGGPAQRRLPGLEADAGNGEGAGEAACHRRGGTAARTGRQARDRPGRPARQRGSLHHGRNAQELQRVDAEEFHRVRAG